MNWLITGGCGFIGRTLVKHLLDSSPNVAIRIVDDFSVGSPADLDRVCEYERLVVSRAGHASWRSGVQLVKANVMNHRTAVAVTKRADVIVHLAANTGVAPSVRYPRADCLTNVIGTFNYLEAARRNGVRRFIFASSGAPLGEQRQLPLHEELAPHPVSPYGASKLAGEGYCSAYAKTYGVETVALRFGNVYGPLSGHKTSVVAKFIRAGLCGQPLEVFGDGTQTRDFIFSEDLVGAIIAAASKPGVAGEIFQIATSSETTVYEVATNLRDIFREAGLSDVSVFYTAERKGDVRRNFSDTRKAREKLGWVATTTLKDGLRRTVKWFLSSGDRGFQT